MNPPHRTWTWPVFMLLLPWVLLLTLILLHVTGRYVLTETLGHDVATNLSSAMSSSAGALLGLVIATLAILTAFPDRPATAKLRRFTAWPVLQYGLLATALNLLVLLAVTLIAIADDRFYLRDATLAFACASGIGLLLCGALFGLVLLNVAKDES